MVSGGNPWDGVQEKIRVSHGLDWIGIVIEDLTCCAESVGGFGGGGMAAGAGMVYPMFLPAPTFLFHDPRMLCMTMSGMESGSVHDAPFTATAKWQSGMSSSRMRT